MSSLSESYLNSANSEDEEQNSTGIRRSISSMDTREMRPISPLHRAHSRAATPLSASMQKDYQMICARLTSDIQELNQRIKFLESENEILANKLSDQITAKSKLQMSKEEMSKELEELSKSLFEEANELVAKEARQKHQLQLELEAAKKKIIELQDRYELEGLQLKELRNVIKEQNISDSSNHSKSNITDFLTFSTLDVRPRTFEEWKSLFARSDKLPEESQVIMGDEELRMAPITRTSHHILDHEKKIWSQVNSSLYQEFTDWLAPYNHHHHREKQSESQMDRDYDDSDDHALVQRIWEHDISPTLTFPLKSKTFSRRLAKAIAANKISIEPLVPELAFSKPNPSDSTFLSHFSRLTNLSLPDIITADRTDDSCVIRPATPSSALSSSSCSLCGMTTSKMHKFNFEGGSDNQLSAFALFSTKDQRSTEMLIDESCHARIVSVCDYFSFLRHYHQGLYSQYTEEALFLHWIQLLRGMFYARTAGSGYFIASDLVCLRSRIGL